MYSYAAVVGANDPDRGDSAAFNTAAFFAGIEPTNLPTIDDDVEYEGTAAAGVGSESGSESTPPAAVARCTPTSVPAGSWARSV